jgi:hypothetical protein
MKIVEGNRVIDSLLPLYFLIFVKVVNFLREDRARSVSIFKFKINTRSGRP